MSVLHFEIFCIVQSYMDSEIRAIMAQYMPLDGHSDADHHLQEELWLWYDFGIRSVFYIDVRDYVTRLC